MQDPTTQLAKPYKRRLCSTLVILALCCLTSFLIARDTPIQRTPVQNLVQESTPIAQISRHSAAIPRTDFFPLESLDEETRKLSEELLQKALESEAFYTLIGQLKPVSEGFWGSYFALDPLDISEVERVRAALRPWNVPELYHADVLVYESPMRGQRYASAYVAHVPTLRAVIQKHHDFFARWGITAATPPGEVIMAIEKCRQPDDRWRGFGRLFGYPEYAIDFFVNAGLHQRTTGEFVERDFRQIPTPGSRTGRFVYAAPKLSRPGEEDLTLERRATLFLSEYRRLRSHETGAKVKPIDLMRDWMDDGQGYCHPQHLLDKLPSKTNEELDAEIAREKASVTSAPVVKFNHLYIVLDQETFESIRQSEILRHQLAASDQGFPKFDPVDDQCQAIYLRGQDTYLEFFGPQNKFHEPVGKIGIGWTVESLGELDRVAEQLRKIPSTVPQTSGSNSQGTNQIATQQDSSPSAYRRELKQWDFDRPTPVNWYHVVFRDKFAAPHAVWWFSEYHVDFIPALTGNTAADQVQIARRDFLRTRYDATRPLKNVTRLKLQLPLESARELRADLEQLDWQVDEFDARTWILTGSDFRIHLSLVAASQSPKLQSIGFETNTKQDSALSEVLEPGCKIQLDGQGNGWFQFDHQQ